MDVPILIGFLRPIFTVTPVLSTGDTDDIYSRLSRCSTARGSGTGFSLLDPTKVKARKLAALLLDHLSFGWAFRQLTKKHLS